MEQSSRAAAPWPVLVVVGGRVASGKSTVARALAEQLGAVHLEVDQLRAEVLASADAPAAHEAQWPPALAPRFEADVYGELLRRAGAVLTEGRPVVLDGCFARRRLREEARAAAKACGAPFLFVECRADAAVVRARLAERDAGSGAAFWQAASDDLAARWEPVDELDAHESVHVAGDAPVTQTLAELSTRLPQPVAWELPLRPRAVTFDCWNTLLYEDDWPTAHARRVEVLAAAAAEAGRRVTQAEAGRAFDSAWERHMRIWQEGETTGAGEVARWALAELGLREPHPAQEHLVAAFEEASHSGRVLALPGAERTLEALTGAGVPCALVCDTGLTPGRVVRRHLERLGLLAGLSVQVFSDEVGAPKPHPRTFRAALEPLGVGPEHALHVGDLRRTDVAGARGLGMGAVRIRALHDDASGLPEADFVVDSHAELLGLFGLG